MSLVMNVGISYKFCTDNEKICIKVMHSCWTGAVTPKLFLGLWPKHSRLCAVCCIITSVWVTWVISWFQFPLGSQCCLCLTPQNVMDFDFFYLCSIYSKHAFNSYFSNIILLKATTIRLQNFKNIISVFAFIVWRRLMIFKKVTYGIG